jgi:hypothetical protein
MNTKELDNLVKKSIFSININDDLKDSVIENYMTQLNTVIKKEKKRKKLTVLIISS